MVRGIVGRKVGMTQIFDEEGRQVPVTVIRAGPCHVTQVRTVEKDGYAAVQIGFEDVPHSRLNRPQQGHQKGLAKGRKADLKRQRKEVSGSLKEEGLSDKDKAAIQRRLDAIDAEAGQAGDLAKRYLFEVKCEGEEAPEIGASITVEIFSVGDKVKVRGTSKGKGFAGAVKRHGFHGSDKGHGSMVPRKPQSSGATDAARTFKGTRKPGQMGNARRTQRGGTVLRIDPERGLLLIKGCVPGPNKGVVVVSRQG